MALHSSYFRYGIEPWPLSQPVDPRQLAARLQAVVDGTEGAPPPPSPGELVRHELVKAEQEAYEALVAEGGVPLYPFRHIERAVANPCLHLQRIHPSYRPARIDTSSLNLARVWAWKSSSDASGALSEQLTQWREFQSWQRKQRGGFSLSRCQQSIERRLKRHGHAHEFRIDKDPENQGRRASWVEFISYICLQIESVDKETKPLQKRRRKCWKALVESGVLRPGETEETLADQENIVAGEREQFDALVAWKYPQYSAQASPEAPSHLSVAKAKEAWEAIRRRNDHILVFLSSTTDIRQEEYPARRYREQLAWASEQLRVIERELEAAKTTEEPMQDQHSPRRLKRRRDHSTTTISDNLEPQSDTPQKMPPSKRRRLRALQPSAAQEGRKTTTPRSVKARTCKTEKQAGQLQSPEATPRRRSYRIAAMRIGKGEA